MSLRTAALVGVAALTLTRLRLVPASAAEEPADRSRPPGFHTRSGVRVGTSRGDLPVPRSSCLGGTCAIPLHDGPDAPGTGFRIRRDRVVRIAVGYG